MFRDDSQNGTNMHGKVMHRAYGTASKRFTRIQLKLEGLCHPTQSAGHYVVYSDGPSLRELAYRQFTDKLAV